MMIRTCLEAQAVCCQPSSPLKCKGLVLSCEGKWQFEGIPLERSSEIAYVELSNVIRVAMTATKKGKNMRDAIFLV